MKALTLLSVLIFSASLFAQEGREAFKSVGQVYNKTEGACSAHVDIMKWYNYDEQGLVTFALTDRPLVRPLTGYSIAATTSVEDLLPVGQGQLKSYPNQPVPMKSEMEIQANGNVNIYLHHKGKGSLGGIIFDAPGYAKQNHKFEFFFSNKNAEGLFETLDVTYHDLKGLRPKRKVYCSFTLSK